MASPPDLVCEVLCTRLGNWLIERQRCALCPGSGAVGIIEALGRGAYVNVGADMHASACCFITTHFQYGAQTEHVTIWRADVLKVLPVSKRMSNTHSVLQLANRHSSGQA